MIAFRPPRAYLVTTTLVFLAVSAVVAAGGWSDDPVLPAVLFLGLGVALPEAYLAVDGRTATPPSPAVTERALIVGFSVVGYAVGLSLAGRPALVGIAAMAGALAAEGFASGRRAARSLT